MTVETTNVPLHLADYIAQRGEPVEVLTRCSGCFEHPAVASDGVNDYCLVCWAGMHYYDQAERKVVRAVITAVLDAVVSDRLVRQVVQDWLAKDDA